MTGSRSRSAVARILESHRWTRLVSLLTVGLVSAAGALWAVPRPQQAPQQAAGQAAPSNAQQDKSQKPASDKKQDTAAKPAVPESSRRVYSVRDGTEVYYRSEETDRKPTKDGEVETQTIRQPSFNGDNRVLLQNEVRTKNLPDGTVEKEYVTKNTDGANHLEPTEMVRERIKKSGDKTTVERETLTSDGEGHWNTVRKEQVNESGTDAARKSVKEVMLPDASGGWSVVDREVTSEKKTKQGDESHTVRQIPDAYGHMSDFEVKDESTTSKDGKETHQVSLSRRDSQDTDHPKLQLVDKTTQVKTTSPDGKQVTIHTTKESDLLDGGTTRNPESSHPQVVEDSTETVTKTANGGEKKVVNVKERTAGNPNSVRPSYQVTTETDKDGNVRQVFLPSSDH
ncbi:MAG TPA: hypothetical protein VG204_23165 [Terriglobia bacterium]|nr:hypothetical protein [Terriglobia bacterium]